MALTGCDLWSPARTVVAPVGSRAGRVTRGAYAGQVAARFELLSPASAVTVRMTAAAHELYRIATPADSGLTPSATVTRHGVRAALRAVRGAGADTVEVLLNPAVRWELLLRAGAGEYRLDLAAAQLSGVTVFGGAGAVRVWLPRPVSLVPVRLAAPVGRTEVYLPPGVRLEHLRHGFRPAASGYVLDARPGRLIVHR